MPNEISVDYGTGFTLYAARFQPDGNVFVTTGASDEVWATADNYDVTMTEDGVGGHYVGDFDASANISAGVYDVAVYLQSGGSPANADTALFRGKIYWDGTTENDTQTMTSDLETIISDVAITNSDLTIISSDVIVAISDIAVVNALLGVQLNDLNLDIDNG